MTTPPLGVPNLSKRSSKYLPKRLLLLFRSVFALPKASSRGFDSRKTFFTRSTSDEPVPAEQSAKYVWMCFDASVLPAPDSPEMMTHCDSSSSVIARNAASAMAKTCGGTSRRLWRM